MSDLELEIYRDSKCSNCNCALNDCSLCGVTQFDWFNDDTPIC